MNHGRALRLVVASIKGLERAISKENVKMNIPLRLRQVAIVHFIMAAVWFAVCVEWVLIARPFLTIQQDLAQGAVESHQTVLSLNEAGTAKDGGSSARKLSAGMGVLAKGSGSFAAGVGAAFTGMIAAISGLAATVFGLTGAFLAYGKPGAPAFAKGLAWIALVFSIVATLLILPGFFFPVQPPERPASLRGLWNIGVLLSGIPYFWVCRTWLATRRAGGTAKGAA